MTAENRLDENQGLWNWNTEPFMKVANNLINKGTSYVRMCIYGLTSIVDLIYKL